jgi:hypothetical protein
MGLERKEVHAAAKEPPALDAHHEGGEAEPYEKSHKARVVDTDRRRLYAKLGYVEAPNRSECRVIVLRGQPLEVDDTLVYLMKRL